MYSLGMMPRMRSAVLTPIGAADDRQGFDDGREHVGNGEDVQMHRLAGRNWGAGLAGNPDRKSLPRMSH